MCRCKEQKPKTEGRRIRELLGPPLMTAREAAKQLGLRHPQEVLRIEEAALEKVARRLRQMMSLDDVSFEEAPDAIHRAPGKTPARDSLAMTMPQQNNF